MRFKSLIKVKSLVQTILEQDPRARNSDSFLYFRVLEIFATQKGLRLNEITVDNFLLNMCGKDFPPFESVRRNRALLQAKYPELRASETVREIRAENEREVRSFVLSQNETL